MSPPPLTRSQGLALLGSTLAYAGLAYATPRPAFGQLLLLFAGAFGCYAWLLYRPLPLRYGLLAALALRLLWLPALPALSDDYHRFRWDGALVAAGQSPYAYRPDELVAAAAPGSPFKTLYPHLNSPHYYSVYPPVCQLSVGLASWLFPASELGFVLVLRLLLLTAEAASAGFLLLLLRRFGLPDSRAFYYLLHPLVVVELIGNLHFEALLICALLAAIWALTQDRLRLSAISMALGVAAKLLPLLLLPLLLRRLGWRKFLAYSSLATVLAAMLFVPFISLEQAHHVGRSLDLYFHKFEFNASLYYLARAVGYQLTGYNEIARIGTGLGIVALLTMLGFVGVERRPTLRTLPAAMLTTLTIYYLLATVVHPWYLTPLLALSVLTRFRYVLVWSGLVVLSYSAYQRAVYAENLELVALEYVGVVAVLVWELRHARRLARARPQ